MTEKEPESNLKFSILPEILRVQLARCSKVASDGAKSGLRPIYGYLLLIVGDSLLTLRAHDPHVTFEGRCVCSEIKSDGEALVECEKLTSILKTRPDGFAIDFWVEKEFLNIRQGEFRAKLPLLRKETIPAVSFKGPFQFELELEPRMLDGMTRCSKVIEEKADSAYAGLLVDLTTEGFFRICGFSRALVHVAQFPLAEKSSLFRMVISPKALPLIETLSRVNQTHFGVDVTNAKIVISSPECSLRIACVEDTYPKAYMEFLGLHKMQDEQYFLTKLDADGRVIDEKGRETIRFNKNQFLDALASAASVLGKEDLAVECNIAKKLADGGVIVDLVGLNRFTKAKAEEKILAASSISSVYQLGIHYAKVRECLRDFEAEVVTFHVGSAQDPFLMIEEGRSDFCSVGIPLKVS